MSAKPLPLSVSIVAIAACWSSPGVAAGTGQGGRDVLHVPISWCAVQGSPAVANPNITAVGGGATDTTTDAILWRRHERPTDNIFLPQADITLRSAINNAWGTLNFPILADPNMTQGVQGDVRGESNAQLGAGSEFQTLIADCDAAWTALGRAGIGITGVNINLFHDGNGDYVFRDAAGNITGGTPIGWGGCARPVGTNVCSAPYDARIMVADNFFLYPTVPDRTLPPSPNDPMGNLQYGATDPFDQLVGHEVGHALGLDHRNVNTALMQSSQQDNDGNGQSDNIALNATEVTSLRQSAAIVPGLEIDPPLRVDPGNFVGMTLPDLGKGDADLPPFLDLASVNGILDKEKGVLSLSARMRGVTPPQGAPPGLIFFALDSDPDRAIAPGAAIELGFPRQLLVGGGFDTLIAAEVIGEKVNGRVWIQRGRELVAIDGLFELRRLTMYPHYTPIEGEELDFALLDVPQDIYNSIVVQLPADLAGVKLGEPFGVSVATTIDREQFDLLDTGQTERPTLILEDPSFPHCVATAQGAPGGTAPVLVDGLLPSRPIHALFGPTEVYRGKTDRRGEASFDLPIPEDARPGLHLVTVGIDDTALTADCVVQVEGEGEPDPRGFDEKKKELLRQRLRLIEQQQRLIEQFGRLIEENMRLIERMGHGHRKCSDQCECTPAAPDGTSVPSGTTPQPDQPACAHTSELHPRAWGGSI